MSACLFCNIIAGNEPAFRIHETPDIIVIRDKYAQAAPHFLVIPKIHVPEFLLVEPETMVHMTEAIQYVIHTQHIHTYRLVCNGKGVAHIDHLHVHILGNQKREKSSSI